MVFERNRIILGSSQYVMALEVACVRYRTVSLDAIMLLIDFMAERVQIWRSEGLVRLDRDIKQAREKAISRYQVEMEH